MLGKSHDRQRTKLDHHALVGGTRPNLDGTAGSANVLARNAPGPFPVEVGEQVGPANRSHLLVWTLAVSAFGSLGIDADARTRVLSQTVEVRPVRDARHVEGTSTQDEPKRGYMRETLAI